MKNRDGRKTVRSCMNMKEYVIEKSKRELGRLDSIFGADATVASLCEDIVKHYEEFRQYEQTGKAMIVAYSRPIANKFYPVRE